MKATRADIAEAVKRGLIPADAAASAGGKRPTKYGNRKVVVDGHRFDSAKEADRYRVLRLLEAAGEVVKLELQVEFPLVVNGLKVCSYRCDFRVTWRDGRVDVEDVKSAATRKLPVYRLKAKLMAACHGITIQEI